MDVEGRPHVEDVLLDVVVVAPVPLESLGGSHRQVLLPAQVELHAGEELRPLDVSHHCHLQGLDLLGPNQQEQVQLLHELEPYYVLGLPVVQDGNPLQLLGENVHLVVVGQHQEDLVAVQVGAVDDVLEGPLDGGAVEEEAVLVVGHEGVDRYEHGLADVLADEGGVRVKGALHFYLYRLKLPYSPLSCNQIIMQQQYYLLNALTTKTPPLCVLPFTLQS